MPSSPVRKVRNHSADVATFLTYPLPDEDVVYDGRSTEHDPHTNHYRGHDGGGFIEVKEGEEDDTWE